MRNTLARALCEESVHYLRSAVGGYSSDRITKVTLRQY
jgi:hypothetical protein